MSTKKRTAVKKPAYATDFAKAPSVKKASAGKKQPKKLVAKKTAKHTIVLVEDEPLIGSVYRDAFAQAGHPLIIAMNKEEALRSIAENQPRLILLDLVIPVTNDLVIEYEHPVGFDILEFMKRNHATEHIHVFVLTNLESKEYERRARELGVDRYYIKTATSPHILVTEAVKVLG